jgi:signal transduction protein with GAF and PtsI domain
MRRLLRSAALIAAAALIAMPVSAEHRKVVDGIAINIGVVPAAQLMRTDAYERSMHREPGTSATHHVVVGVPDAKSDACHVDLRMEAGRLLSGSSRDDAVRCAAPPTA